MRFSFCLALAASTLSAAVPYTRRNHHPHPKRAAPSSPINVASSNFLCDVSSDLSVTRDLGFVGMIQDTMIYTYGDTSSSTGAFYMTSDSSSIGTSDPCQVLNTQRTLGDAHPTDMIAPNVLWGELNTVDGFGGTNVVATQGNDGMMFFLKNHRPMGGDDYIVGAGVASVSLSSSKNVTTTRLADHWWDAQAGEPWYGDIGAYNDGTYIWGYGHGGSTHMYVYLTRVLISGWQDLSNWEYYDGSSDSWSNSRMYNPTSEQALQFNDAEGPAWGVGQGQMIWSPYYNKIVWIYIGDYEANGQGLWDVYARTADQPRGPWSSPVELYTVQQSGADPVYCAVANPYFDSTGKSIVVTVDNGAATLQATKVIFE